MSRSGLVTLFFGEAEFDFRLRIGEAVELQEIADAGLMVTLERVAMLAMKEVKAVLRLGLIGGGMDKAGAFKLVERHVRDGYFAEAAQVAIRVIESAVRGPSDEPLGEPRREGDAPSRTARSATPNSTASASPPASALAPSTSSRSGSSGPRSKATSRRTVAAPTG